MGCELFVLKMEQKTDNTVVVGFLDVLGWHKERIKELNNKYHYFYNKLWGLFSDF